MDKLQRRHALLAMIVAPVVTAGCSRDEVSEATEEMPTSVLQNTRIGLRGFQLVSMTVGQRIIFLPTPGVRVLGVALLVSGLVTFLVVEYLDVELKRRMVKEELSDTERIAAESSLGIEFQTDNGLKEFVSLGPNQYEEVNAVPNVAVGGEKGSAEKGSAEEDSAAAASVGR